MEFWEGAVLVVGGVLLVSYMAKKSGIPPANPTGQSVKGTAQPGSSLMATAPLSNLTNLTNITNNAGGSPTRWGEPLEPPQYPINLPVAGPFVVSPVPIATPIVSPVVAHPILTNLNNNPQLRSPLHQIMV